MVAHLSMFQSRNREVPSRTLPELFGSALRTAPCEQDTPLPTPTPPAQCGFDWPVKAKQRLSYHKW